MIIFVKMDSMFIHNENTSLSVKMILKVDSLHKRDRQANACVLSGFPYYVTCIVT